MFIKSPSSKYVKLSNLLRFKGWDVLNNQVLNGNVHVDNVLTEVDYDCDNDDNGDDEVEGDDDGNYDGNDDDDSFKVVG